ncbi:MAG: hypothetical protein II460_00595, partial [Oscillospiraceae bacterium]|nr:hypothetical protein [Oscillospiraceae bacterium]
LVSYCSGPMKTVPNASGAGSAWVPNLPAAICAAFGVGEPAGSLPVDVPALDADFHLTPTVLYSRRTNELNPDAVLQLPPETAEEEAPVSAAA